MASLNMAIWLEDASEEGVSASRPDTECCPISRFLRSCSRSAAASDAAAALNSDVELHLNFWKIPGHESLDIGIRYKCISKKSRVCIFLPEKNPESILVEDLGHLLHAQERIRHAVFNEIATISSCKEKIGIYNKISTHGDKDFCVCDINQDDIKKIKLYTGNLVVQVRVPGRSCKPCCDYSYIRLRLTGTLFKDSYAIEVLPKSRLENYTSKIEIFDFRLNSVRTLPPKLVHDLKNRMLHFTTVQCFLMCPSREELALYHGTYRNVRFLENDIWSEYFPALESQKENRVLAYQWKAEKTQDFSLFTKICSDSWGWGKFFITLMLILSLGVISSLAGTYIWTAYHEFFISSGKNGTLSPSAPSESTKKSNGGASAEPKPEQKGQS